MYGVWANLPHAWLCRRFFYSSLHQQILESPCHEQIKVVEDSIFLVVSLIFLISFFLELDESLVFVLGAVLYKNLDLILPTLR